MKEEALPLHRQAATTGLAVAAAIALWWLGSTRLALDSGANPGRSAQAALQALLLARGLALALLSLRASALHGWRAGAWAAFALVAPAWPVVALAWSASTAPLVQLLGAECLLLAGCLALPLLGWGLRCALRGRAELAELLATLGAAALAASWWFALGPAGHWPLLRY
ncbi:hypothetical protein [Paucibacter soli]|uniref:hypothetical protein n=1 Tax=Paucibacter soli TaxID=3133433 RepID=UPI0030A30A01